MSKPSLTIDTARAVDPPIFGSGSDDIYESQIHTATLTTLSSTLKTLRSPPMDEKFDEKFYGAGPPEEPQPPSAPYVAPQPSFRLLLSLTTRTDAILLLPAILAAACAAAMPALMAVVVGQAFDTFARFPLTLSPSAEAKADLLHGIGLVALYLAAIAAGVFLLSGALSGLWIWFGERTVMRLRRLVYTAVASRDMEWFDLGAGADQGEGEESVGAGGLMAKFARDTDDVRLATSLNMGMLFQHIFTFIVTLVIAFKRSPTLTLVVLASIPLMVLVQFLTQKFSFRFLTTERNSSANASTTIDRAIASITTVKAFNAQAFEEARSNYAFEEIRRAARSCAAVWSGSSGFSGFIMFGMYVQGFWYGSKLVRDGQISPGDVLVVFWACLIASSSLQMTIPLLVVYTRGKSAMASLMTVVHPPPSSNQPRRSDSSTHRPIADPKSPFYKSSPRKPVSLQKIKPETCKGAFDLRNVTFAYPSRPSMPVLEDVSIYVPECDTTFIVGGSGSGKSTLAQLLLRLYEPNSGEILLDEQDFFHLDTEWSRSHIAAVSQGCILFDMSVHDNIAMGLAGSDSGRKPSDATREEVIAACRSALMHDFVRDLPDGYDTRLGDGGANLSGGQKQRLAIARAFIRNPTVLILDEATSALDGTSRLLVFEAIKKWRKNRTTIVITHDLSQIGTDDFVYVLSQGRVVEQGFRRDLEEPREGEFYQMMITQGATGGFLPVKDVTTEEKGKEAERDALVEQTEAEARKATSVFRHQSALAGFSFTPDARLFEAVARGSLLPPPTSRRPSAATVRFFPEDVINIPESPRTLRFRRSSLTISVPRTPIQRQAWRRNSLQFSPTSPAFLRHKTSDMTMSVAVEVDSPRHSDAFDPASGPVTIEEFHGPTSPSLEVKIELPVIEDDDDFEKDKTAMRMTAMEAATKRRMNSTRRRWEEKQSPSLFAPKRFKRSLRPRRKPVPPLNPALESVVVAKKSGADEEPQLSFMQLVKIFWPLVPIKVKIIVFCGLFVSLLNGAITPIFAFLLSQLLAMATSSGQSASLVNQYAVVVLFLAFASGVTFGLKYFLLELAGANWVHELRKRAFQLVMKQDKQWFDQSKNSAPLLVQVLMKDTDTTREFISFAGQIVVVVVMLSVGLIWALVQGWQLTLVGFAIGPFFAAATVIQSRFLAKFELRNKRCREEVNKKYYDSVANIRAIRGMHLEGVFKADFEKSIAQAAKSGKNGAFVEGMGYGVANGLIYLSEGLLFYVGAVLIANGTYTYLQMIQVINLVVFSVAIAAQMLSFIQRIGKTVQAARDLERLISLKSETVEAHGKSRYQVQGEVVFHHIDFAYPSRPEVQVLKDFNLKIKHGECVAIVGASGCGKSTIAGLMQRLYEPTGGFMSINGHRLSDTDAMWLRNRIAVVSQQAHLFDASVGQNIAYGTDIIDHSRIVQAAKEANAHDFIMTLPQGYNTHLGENASLISGGQAQRIQIARALVRSSSILILDECTSALDAENQKTIMSTIKHVKLGRTTIMITHKLPVMQMADRILVIADGGIAEEGTYDDLMARKGTFWKLTTAGEWEGE